MSFKEQDNLINQEALDPTKLKEFIQDVDKETDVPNGYIPIELSSNGKLYAPKLFHIRNFTTEDLMGLSIADEKNLPIKVIKMLQELVWEKDVKIRDFSEPEVTEMLVILYRTFYSHEMSGIDYTMTKKDWDYLAETNGGYESEEFLKVKGDIINKRFEPKINIDLNTVEFFTLDDNFKYTAKAKKTNGFECKYTFPRYGDTLTLVEWQNKIFGERDKRFESVERIIKFRKEQEDRAKKGEEINLRSIPTVPKQQEQEYNEYITEKNIFLMIAIRALHLKEINGVDVSNEPLDKKLELAKNPELDYPTFKKIYDKFNSLKVGINHEVLISNPLSGEVQTYTFPFSISNILQALQSTDANGVDVEFE